MIDMLLSGTQPTMKQSKECETFLVAVIGVPQGDGLSPRIFILYLDEVLTELEETLFSRSQTDQYNQKDLEHPEPMDMIKLNKSVPYWPTHKE